MKKLFACVITLLFVLNACHQSSKTQQEDRSLFNWENAQSFISDDSRFEFMMMADSGKEHGIVLLDKNSGTIYHLDHVTAASGVKCTDEGLDTEQVDPTAFSKVLSLQGIGFSVSSIRRDNGMSDVSITPFGLEIDNRVQNQTIEGVWLMRMLKI